ncbi:SulP family inorganic anion transporter [Amycolatopsis sp. H20-H5]|uniref:SulP family inorganic anion transporter n=1 Tax=Amycolatopsis sp. H20-H5 TaxID=3046309 RepID=UPI002DBCA801|nr:SulP family inorganic anion transporter [Amycolatopsis sp. H20-H5]MEC3975814.1 SulP family inorganic anion transporter [Amycolatopsis sp. H20-H5]
MKGRNHAAPRSRHCPHRRVRASRCRPARGPSTTRSLSRRQCCLPVVIASGLCGGLPATGAIARTAVNARSGAQTRVAALTHALLLAVIYAASELVGRIPLVALAGVLLVVAYRMVERHTVRAVLRSTRADAVVFVMTAVCTMAFDLITAVEAGPAVAVPGRGADGEDRSSGAGVVEPDGITSDTEHALLTKHVPHPNTPDSWPPSAPWPRFSPVATCSPLCPRRSHTPRARHALGEQPPACRLVVTA